MKTEIPEEVRERFRALAEEAYKALEEQTNGFAARTQDGRNIFHSVMQNVYMPPLVNMLTEEAEKAFREHGKEYVRKAVLETVDRLLNI